MKRQLTIMLAITALAGAAAAARKRLTVQDLPPAVQKTVQETAKGAQINGKGGWRRNEGLICVSVCWAPESIS